MQLWDVGQKKRFISHDSALDLLSCMESHLPQKYFFQQTNNQKPSFSTEHIYISPKMLKREAMCLCMEVWMENSTQQLPKPQFCIAIIPQNKKAGYSAQCFFNSCNSCTVN